LSCIHISSPGSYADTVTDLLASATPRKRELLFGKHKIRSCQKERHAVEVIASSAKEISKDIKNGSNKSMMFRRAFNNTFKASRNKSMVAKLLGVHRKAFLLKSKYKKLSRQKRKDCLSKDVISKVISLYRSPTVARERPEKRFKGRYLMFLSQRQAYRLFCNNNPTISINTQIRIEIFQVFSYYMPMSLLCKCGDTP